MHARSIALVAPMLLWSGCLTAQRSVGPGAAVDAAIAHSYRPGIDVLDYNLSLELPARGNEIAGDAVLSVRRTARVDTLVLDLVGLVVDSVRVDGVRASFSRPAGEIHVALPQGVTGTFRVDVAYRGAVEDGLIIRTDGAGRWTGFGDNWPNRARYWIPSVDHPSDKATVSWNITAPADRTVVANGVLVDRTTLSDGRVRTRWREEHPIAVYLMVVAAAPLSEYSLGQTACGLASDGRCVPQYVYTAPEQRTMLPGAFAQAAEIVRYFSSLVGAFPYEKLAHLQSSTRFGGMENATAIFYADQPFRKRTMADGVVAHETAHQWFGDAVTETEWSHLWLSEGFATYFAALWTRKSAGDSGFRAEMEEIRRVVLSSRVVAERPVIDTAQQDLMALLNENSYQKGGFVLHMLRTTLGDSAFFRGLHRYYDRYRNGNALSDDLRRELEAASGRPLGWFFDQWLRRPGFPELTTSWTYDAVAKRVVVSITQGARFGSYRFPLTIDIKSAAGRWVRTRVPVPAQTRTQVTLDPLLDTAPADLVIDPDVELLARIVEQ